MPLVEYRVRCDVCGRATSWHEDGGEAEAEWNAKAEDAARPQAPVLLPEPSRFYSLAQLKAVVSFMELCGIQQIDIDATERFCRAMKVDIYAAIGGLNA